MKVWKVAVMIAYSLFIINPTTGEAMNDNTITRSLMDVPVTAWQNLAQNKICFGHQSVGDNILEGINELRRENPQINLNIVESKSNVATAHGSFNHFRVGKNMNPNSKIVSFEKYMEQANCRDADIAFYKFCYVDVAPDTDPEALFEAYRKSMKNLMAAFPRTTFVHVTLPLTKRQTGLKAMIKKILGKPVSGIEDNIVRNRYNELLLKEYGGKAPVFDLARIEATNPDGKRELFDKNGTKFMSMVPSYTDDDGHLNKTGRRVVATELLRFLITLNLKVSS